MLGNSGIQFVGSLQIQKSLSVAATVVMSESAPASCLRMVFLQRNRTVEMSNGGVVILSGKKEITKRDQGAGIVGQKCLCLLKV